VYARNKQGKGRRKACNQETRKVQEKHVRKKQNKKSYEKKHIKEYKMKGGRSFDDGLSQSCDWLNLQLKCVDITNGVRMIPTNVFAPL
jgi:hypothetical protein